MSDKIDTTLAYMGKHTVRCCDNCGAGNRQPFPPTCRLCGADMPAPRLRAANCLRVLVGFGWQQSQLDGQVTATMSVSTLVRRGLDGVDHFQFIEGVA